MQKTIIEDPTILDRCSNKLEKELGVKIKVKENEVLITGPGESEYIATQIIEAFNLGFSYDYAITLKNEENILQVINIKDLTHRKNLELIRGRIIGTYGGTIRTVHELTSCAISLKDNQVGIIGHVEDIEDAIQAIKSLVQGSKQGNIYARIERHNREKKLAGKVQIKKTSRINNFKNPSS